MINFPHANGFELKVQDFVAAWRTMAIEMGHGVHGWEQVSLPRHNQKVLLAQMLPLYRMSLDVMARMLVPERYQNVMQVTNPWMDANAQWVAHTRVVGATGREVNGARLTVAAINEFKKHQKAK